MAYIFQLLAGIISVFTLLCFVRIIITWIPGIAYSVLGRFLSSICDPYLNLFRRLNLRIGNLDLTPAVAVGILTAASSILGNIASTGRVYIGGIIALLLGMLWSLASSLVGFLLILLIIRYIVLLFSRRENYYGSMWTQLDNTLNSIVFRISGFFTNRRPVSYKRALLISIITLIVMLICCQILVHIIIRLISSLPF